MQLDTISDVFSARVANVQLVEGDLCLDLSDPRLECGMAIFLALFVGKIRGSNEKIMFCSPLLLAATFGATITTRSGTHAPIPPTEASSHSSCCGW